MPSRRTDDGSDVYLNTGALAILRALPEFDPVPLIYIYIYAYIYVCVYIYTHIHAAEGLLQCSCKADQGHDRSDPAQLGQNADKRAGPKHVALTATSSTWLLVCF